MRWGDHVRLSAGFDSGPHRGMLHSALVHELWTVSHAGSIYLTCSSLMPIFDAGIQVVDELLTCLLCAAQKPR